MRYQVDYDTGVGLERRAHSITVTAQTPTAATERALEIAKGVDPGEVISNVAVREVPGEAEKSDV